MRVRLNGHQALGMRTSRLTEGDGVPRREIHGNVQLFVCRWNDTTEMGYERTDGHQQMTNSVFPAPSDEGLQRKMPRKVAAANGVLRENKRKGFAVLPYSLGEVGSS